MSSLKTGKQYRAPRYLSLSVALILAGMGSASASASTRIVGGNESTEGTWPWIVSLQKSSASNAYEGHFCGGSLIAANWVLTAAHCIADSRAEDIAVRIGGWDLSSSSKAGTRVAVSRILAYPSYDADTYDNDLALLQLATSQSTSSKLPVISASAMLQLVAGDPLVVMGWGTTKYGTNSYPAVLREVSVPLVAQATCVSNYNASGTTITDNMLCAGEATGGKDSCQGDSGGPLVSDASGAWQQVGVVSFGTGCADAQYPGVYTRLANYHNWLNQHQAHLSADTKLDFGYVPEYYPLAKNINVVNFGSTAKLDSSTVSTNQAFTLGTNGCLTDVAQGASCQLAVSLAGMASGEYAAEVTSTGSNELVALKTNLLATVLPVKTFSNAIGDGITWYSGGDGQWHDSLLISSQPQQLEVGFETLTRGNAVLQTVVTGPVTASFKWRLSNGDGYSSLTAYLDGVKVATASGSWDTPSVAVGSGSHVLEWRYTTSGSTGLAQLASFSTSSSDGGTTTTPVTSSGNVGGGSIGIWTCLILGGGLLLRRKTRAS